MGLRFRRPDLAVMCLGCVFVLWLLSQLGECVLWLLSAPGDCVLWLLGVLGDGTVCGVELPDVCLCLFMPGYVGLANGCVTDRDFPQVRTVAPKYSTAGVETSYDRGSLHTLETFAGIQVCSWGCRTRTGCPTWSGGALFLHVCHASPSSRFACARDAQ